MTGVNALPGIARFRNADGIQNASTKQGPEPLGLSPSVPVRLQGLQSRAGGGLDDPAQAIGGNGTIRPGNPPGVSISPALLRPVPALRWA